MRTSLQTKRGHGAVAPLRYSRHASFGARIFFNHTGYQAHTIVCWFERDKQNKGRWVFRARRRGAEMPPDELRRHYFRACKLLRQHGLDPEASTYSDIVELAKSFESRIRCQVGALPGLAG